MLWSKESTLDASLATNYSLCVLTILIESFGTLFEGSGRTDYPKGFSEFCSKFEGIALLSASEISKSH